MTVPAYKTGGNFPEGSLRILRWNGYTETDEDARDDFPKQVFVRFSEDIHYGYRYRCNSLVSSLKYMDVCEYICICVCVYSKAEQRKKQDTISFEPTPQRRTLTQTHNWVCISSSALVMVAILHLICYFFIWLQLLFVILSLSSLTYLLPQVIFPVGVRHGNSFQHISPAQFHELEKCLI